VRASHPILYVADPHAERDSRPDRQARQMPDGVQVWFEVPTRSASGIKPPRRPDPDPLRRPGGPPRFIWTHEAACCGFADSGDPGVRAFRTCWWLATSWATPDSRGQTNLRLASDLLLTMENMKAHDPKSGTNTRQRGWAGTRDHPWVSASSRRFPGQRPWWRRQARAKPLWLPSNHPRVNDGVIDRLREALQATALWSADLATRDLRDVMIDLALHCDVARRLGGSPPNIFNEVAERLAECPIADLLRHFGARTDINLEAFGSDLMEARRDWLSSPR